MNSIFQFQNGSLYQVSPNDVSELKAPQRQLVLKLVVVYASSGGVALQLNEQNAALLYINKTLRILIEIAI